MQTPQPEATPAPQSPRAPVSITVVGADGKSQTITIPVSESDVEELLAHRQELSDQLSSVTDRRSNLAAEIRRTTDDASRTGLQDRLRLLDNRILQLETDLATVGRQLAAAPAELVSGTREEPNNRGSEDGFDEGLMAGGFSVFFASAIFFLFARRRWRRQGSTRRTAIGDDTARLERLEHGMDAIAIEIERVSEGQRFVTKLLSEAQHQPAPAQRIPQPVTSQQHEP
jgi:hypothetical protein